MATVPVTRGQWKLSAWDVFYALDMALACLISYTMVAHVLSPFLGTPDAFLGGMWASVATVFVFRETRVHTLSAGMARLAATAVSFALCLAYLVILPFHPAGLAALVGVGTAIMMHLGRREDIVTTAVTTTVVMVGAAISPQDAWRQPIWRLCDTVLGIGVGVTCKWLASFLYYRCIRQRPK